MTNDDKNPAQPPRQDVLPDWLYPTAFWVALALLAAGLIVPALNTVGVIALLVTPALAAAVVMVTHWRKDRALSVAALLALLGLGLVFVVRTIIARVAE